MKICIVINQEGNELTEAWSEEMIVEETQCLYSAPEGLTHAEYGQLVIDNFNFTLKPGEKRRVLLDTSELEHTVEHAWFCDCGQFILFQQPELPGDGPSSEQNGSKTCSRCGDSMWFDVVQDEGDEDDWSAPEEDCDDYDDEYYDDE